MSERKSGSHNILDLDRINRHRAMKLVSHARHFLDLQRSPSEERVYQTNEEETLLLLSVGASVIGCKEKEKGIVVKMEYEGVHFRYESETPLDHPSIKKAGA